MIAQYGDTLLKNALPLLDLRIVARMSTRDRSGLLRSL